jgi:hypothetical protein
LKPNDEAGSVKQESTSDRMDESSKSNTNESEDVDIQGFVLRVKAWLHSSHLNVKPRAFGGVLRGLGTRGKVLKVCSIPSARIVHVTTDSEDTCNLPVNGKISATL